MNSVLIFCVAIVAISLRPVLANADEFRTVDTSYGPVRGKKLTTIYESVDYFSFRGIPYAEPPIGELRFRAPVEYAQKWTEPRDALEFGASCIQQHYSGVVDGDEDCLFLNIYVPKNVNEDEKLAVMVYIHGGGFYEGYSHDFFLGPDFFINKNVILVTLNYRLGPLGFLTLNTNEYSGNMGLKDQTLAMKWVHQNIEKFNGDTNRITVAGHSAGGASAHFHTLSPLSQGLFQRIIPMSGTVLNIWSINLQSKERHVAEMTKLAKNNNYNGTTLLELIEFLKGMDALTLVRDSFHPLGDRLIKHINLIWLPVIEDESVEGAFLTERPEITLNKTGHSTVDAMFGNTNLEMLFVIGRELKDPNYVKDFYDNFKVQLPSKRDALNSDYSASDYELMAAEVKKFYFKEPFVLNDESKLQYTTLLSDVFFSYGVYKSIKYQVDFSTGNTYFYTFSVDERLNWFKKAFNSTMLAGSSHGDELCYVFKCGSMAGVYQEIAEESPERKAIENISILWTNFMKFGNPTPDDTPVEWKPITSSNKVYNLDIGAEVLTLTINPRIDTVKFWNKLYVTYHTNNYDNDPLATAVVTKL